MPSRGIVVLQIGVVQEPGEVAPSPERLLQVDGVGGARANHAHEFRSIGLVANRLGMEEYRHHRLLRLALAQSRDISLDPSRDLHLLFQQRAPVRPHTLRTLRSGDAGEIGNRLGNTLRTGSGQQRCRTDHRTLVPPFGFAQRRRQRTQNASGTLKSGQLRPAAVEHVAEVRVERIAPAEAVFFLPPVLLRGGVQARQGSHHADDVRVLRPRIMQAVRIEESAAQHLGDILPSDGLNAFFPLPPDDVEQIGLQGLAQIVVLALIGSEQGGHHGRPVHLGDGLHEMLEEIHDPLAPDLTQSRLAPRVHQHFVHENQGAEVPASGVSQAG